MARRELSVQPREVTGKKVAALRRAGILPANIFGHGLDSVSVQVATEEMEHTVRAAVANEVIDLKIDGERETRPVVIHHIHRHPLTSAYLHADFYQVSLREKLRADVPLVFSGTSVAVETYNGVLVTSLESVHVEGLPLDIPSHIEVDISSMRQLEDGIFVRDLVLPGSVTILNDPEIMVAKIASPAVSEEGEEAAAAAPAAQAGGEPEASAEEESGATEAES